VNKTFWADLDQNHLDRVSAAVDPVNEIYVLCYPGAGNVGGTPNRLLLYRWTVDRWSRAEPGPLELVYAGTSQQGYTLEQLDAVAADLGGLPFGLDSVVWTGIARPLFAGFDAAHRLGYFNGPNLPAVVDTAEAQLTPGRRSLLRSLRPLADGGAVTVRIGTRDAPGAPVQFGSAVAPNGLGAAALRSSARYHRARLSIAAGESWTHLQGVEVDAVPEGVR
jgi:hypothetical protein